VSPRTRTRPPHIPEICYELDVVGWAVASTDAVQINVSVRFQTPVKGVQEGDLLIYSDEAHDKSETVTGTISYNDDHCLRGCLWIGSHSGQLLVTLLAAGHPIELHLYGKPFRYRSAFVNDVFWYTKGHPDLKPRVSPSPHGD
jgi:hypothetical protein